MTLTVFILWSLHAFSWSLFLFYLTQDRPNKLSVNMLIVAMGGPILWTIWLSMFLSIIVNRITDRR